MCGNVACYGTMQSRPPARTPLPSVRKPNLHSDRGQDSNPCAWRPLGPQSAHGSTVPRRPRHTVRPYRKLQASFEFRHASNPEVQSHNGIRFGARR
ncbi:hypothetical protein E2C01_030997 [Portunus trituberculatus]|uniref:Uncharacterized protein n=1 Tax=Portunus trituberculatus TaxID=210409 RepID=A0A5B7EWF5_PORTR|nr:hypothetical protein [Portunus trituberculatus]